MASQILIQQPYETFDGGPQSNYITWIEGYKYWCESFGFSAKEMCLKFPTFLKGEAFYMYQEFSHEVKVNWPELEKAFIQCYSNGDMYTLWDMDFHKLSLRKGDSIEDYISKTRDLGTKLCLPREMIASHMRIKVYREMRDTLFLGLPHGSSTFKVANKIRLLGQLDSEEIENSDQNVEAKSPNVQPKCTECEALKSKVSNLETIVMTQVNQKNHLPFQNIDNCGKNGVCQVS